MTHPAARKVAAYTAGWLAVVVCAVALYQRAAQVPEPMDPDDLSRIARQLASDVAEAQGLARALASGQLTTHFARAQHEQISQDLDDIRKSLDRPPPPGADRRAQQLDEAARRLDEVVKSVPSRMADAQAMAEVANEEAAIGGDIESGGGS